MFNFKDYKMGTNSYIFYEESPSNLQGIYCNFDGNLNGVGITLYRHYQNIEKIKQLINLGSISSLDKECDRNPQYQIMSSYNTEQRHNGYTFAYHRDRKDPIDENQSILKNNMNELENYLHVYLWRNNEWLTFNYEKKQWNSLRNEIVEYYKEVKDDYTEEKIQQYLATPKTIELNVSYQEYLENIRRGFFLTKKEITYFERDYVLIKTVHENKNYELLLQVVDIIENEAINENYQLIVLSNVPSDYAWFYPMTYKT